MKLNNNGWGLNTLLAFIGVFIFCLLLVVYLITSTTRKLEERDAKEEIHDGSTETFNYDEYYNDLETRVYDAVKEYTEDNPKILDKEYFNLNINTLIKNGYIVNFDDSFGEECSGYVEITNDDETTYSVFIKCSEYETIGYDEGKAF